MSQVGRAESRGAVDSLGTPLAIVSAERSTIVFLLHGRVKGCTERGKLMLICGNINATYSGQHGGALWR
ncbi:protein of unknown function [Pararobbsia alpina]